MQGPSDRIRLESEKCRLTCEDDNLRFLALEVVDSSAGDLTRNFLALNNDALIGFGIIGPIFLIVECGKALGVSFIQFDLNVYRGEGSSDKSELTIVYKLRGFNRIVGHTWPRYGVNTAMSL